MATCKDDYRAEMYKFTSDFFFRIIPVANDPIIGTASFCNYRTLHQDIQALVDQRILSNFRAGYICYFAEGNLSRPSQISTDVDTLAAFCDFPIGKHAVFGVYYKPDLQTSNPRPMVAEAVEASINDHDQGLGQSTQTTVGIGIPITFGVTCSARAP